MKLHAKNPKDPLIVEVKWGDYFSGVSGKGFINITEIAGAAGVRKPTPGLIQLQDRPTVKRTRICL